MESSQSSASKLDPKRMKGEKCNPVSKDSKQKKSPNIKPATRSLSAEKGDKKFVKFKLESETIEDVYGREAYTTAQKEEVR